MRIFSFVMVLFLMFSSNLLAKDVIYGNGVSLTKVTKISEIHKDPLAYEGKKVLIEGMVTSVCESRGCWMNIASDQRFQEMMIKVVDGKIVFPMSAEGKMAKVEGIVEDANNLDASEKSNPKHKLGDYKKKNSEKLDAQYRIRALGAVITE